MSVAGTKIVLFAGDVALERAGKWVQSSAKKPEYISTFLQKIMS